MTSWHKRYPTRVVDTARLLLLVVFLYAVAKLLNPANEGLILAAEVPFLALVFAFRSRIEALVLSLVVLVLGIAQQGSELGWVVQLQLSSIAFALALVRAKLIARGLKQRHQLVRELGPRRGWLGFTLVVLLAAAAQAKVLSFAWPQPLSFFEHWLLQSAISLAGFFLLECLAWAIFGRPTQRWRNHNAVIVVAGVASLAPVFAIYALAQGSIENQIKRQVTRDAERMAHLFAEQTQLTTQALIAVKSLYDASKHVSRAEFQVFCSNILKSHPALSALEWVKLVPAPERAAFETRAAQELNEPDFSIWEVDTDGNRRPALTREVHYPVEYSEPMPVGQHALGLDFASLAVHLNMIRRALASTDSVVSEPTLLVRDTTPSVAYLQAISVPDHQGLVIGLVRIAGVVSEALAQDPLWSATLSLQLRGEVTGRLIYEQNPLHDRLPHFSHSLNFAVGDRGGQLTVSRSLRLEQPWNIANPHWILVLGLVLGAGLCLIALLFFARSQAEVTALRRDQRREKKAARMQRQLQQSERMASLGAMVSGITHEVNTPLATALLGVDGINRGLQAILREVGEAPRLTDIGERSLDSVRRVKANLRRAGELMDEFKQVASDASSNRVATVKLATLIERVADLMEAKLSAKKVVFKLEAADDLTLNTRPGPLSQVLVILIENSLMHGFEREQFSGLIWVVVKTTPKGICIDYRDNGRGIGADVRNSIFQPFFTTKADRGGTGMGLYLAHTMVEGPLCGQMRCEESSAGAHFVIRLPLETTS